MGYDTLPPLNVIDMIGLILIALGTFRGYRRGLSGELAGVVGIVASLMISIHLFAPFGEWIAANTSLTGQLAHAAAFAVCVLFVIAATILIGAIFRKVMGVFFADGVDKFLGLIAGAVQSAAILAIGLLMMNLLPHPYLNRHFGDESLLGTIVLRATPALHQTLQGLRGVELPPETEETP